MDGWAGRILRVKLTRGNYSVEDLDTGLAEDFIGGRGLSVKYLFDEIDAVVDSLSPENKLLLATGPLTGTMVPASARAMVATKSPLTGAIACANMGGYFGTELKFAGYDMIIIEGKSPSPVYLSIMDGKVEIKPAQHIWGKRTNETEKIIQAEIGAEGGARKAQVISIGPAGENLVKFAGIIHSCGAAARSGVGAVMGSKNLKAIAVRGTRGVTIADKAGFKKAVKVSLDRVKDSKATQRNILYGTWDLIFLAKRLGGMSTRNFQAGELEELKDFDGRDVREEIFVRTRSCYGCPRGTFKVTRVTDPEFEGEGMGPEFESWNQLGPLCGVSNLAATTKASYLCDELGMDTISTGVTIACAMELYEKGYLPEEDVGYKLNFGNAKAMVELVEKMGLRQGFGDVLAEGGYQLARKYGHPELFMGVKKQGMPAWHPQARQDTGLAYATANCGACHTRAILNTMETQTETAGQAAGVKWGQDYIAVIDACGLCWSLWMFQPETLGELVTMMKMATGVDYTEESLLLAGERIWNLERLFNLKAGLTAEDDTLPKRVLEEPCLKGDAEGQVVRLNEMLPEYYQLRGWDKSGVPAPEKLQELGLTQEGEGVPSEPLPS